MDDSLSSGGFAGGGVFDPAFSHPPAAWPSTAPLLAAVEKRDQHGFHDAARRLAAVLLPLAQAVPVAAALFGFDVLRSVAESLRPGRAPLPETERLALIVLLGTQATPAALVASFLAEADRLCTGLSPSRPTQHPVAQRARGFIEAHAAEPLSLARVARELSVTRTYLSALFRRECGITLTEYIHHVRIERAEGLLRQGGLSMAAVASQSGYGSYRHFHRSFLKLRQVSPRAFLRNMERGRHLPSDGWPLAGAVPAAHTPERFAE